MKKFGFLVVLFLASMFSNHCLAQRDTLTLYRPEIRELLQIVKQNSVYDTVDVQRKIRTIKNLQDALATKTQTATVIVDREFVFDFMNRLSWDYMQYERALEQRNKFLRVANGLYLRNPSLSMLKEENLNLNTDYRYSQLAQVRRSLLRDLRFENTVRNTINGADERTKAALIINEN